ncbi:hypothetical protein NDU88_008751 [Pleurodeles waltl]|uniref:Uncharacterized protein n=1 Tax=Pleurodeles waltl TaxID=8319 RepID=A0AAV7PV96_PLEWA|nr:hypothetical protein NDU88_008751 [Pleurodeles waltl]
MQRTEVPPGSSPEDCRQLAPAFAAQRDSTLATRSKNELRVTQRHRGPARIQPRRLPPARTVSTRPQPAEPIIFHRGRRSLDTRACPTQHRCTSDPART